MRSGNIPSHRLPNSPSNASRTDTLAWRSERHFDRDELRLLRMPRDGSSETQPPEKKKGREERLGKRACDSKETMRRERTREERRVRATVFSVALLLAIFMDISSRCLACEKAPKSPRAWKRVTGVYECEHESD